MALDWAADDLLREAITLGVVTPSYFDEGTLHYTIDMQKLEEVEIASQFARFLLTKDYVDEA